MRVTDKDMETLPLVAWVIGGERKQAIRTTCAQSVYNFNKDERFPVSNNWKLFRRKTSKFLQNFLLTFLFVVV